MAHGAKLLLSQVEIIKNVIGLIAQNPHFIVINGESGAGKTTICEALVNYYRSRSTKCVLAYSGLVSYVDQIRSGIIKNFFSHANFDHNDPLTVTCQLFDITRTDGLVVIDSIDLIDQNIIEEFYSFFNEYKSSLNLSIVVTTTKLLSSLLLHEDLVDVQEITIPHLNVKDKKNLLQFYLEKKLADQLANQNYLIDLIEHCGVVPAEIVKFVENNEMSGMNFNEDDLTPKNSASPKTIVPNSEEAPRANKHTIAKPTAPNKTIVIAVAVVLALILIGIVSLLLKKQNVSNPEEVVVTQQVPNKPAVDTVVESANINNHDQEELDQDESFEKQMIENMMSGSNDLTLDAPIEIAEPEINESVIKEQATKVANKAEETAQKVEEKVAKVEEAPKVVEEKQEQMVINLLDEPKETATMVQEKVAKTEEKVTKAQEQATAKVAKAQEQATAKAAKAQEQATAKVAKVQEQATEKVAKAKEVAKTVEQNKAQATKVANDPKAKVENTKAKATLKVGEVKSFAELSNNSSTTQATPLPASAPSAKNFVVQVACSGNKADLQAKSAKYGANAFIYERKNNALKYVLVVGYYATQQDAAAAAKKFGNGAFTKSMSAVNKERK